MTDYTKAQLKLAQDVTDKLLDGKTLDEKVLDEVTGERILEIVFMPDATLVIEFSGDRKLTISAQDPDCCAILYLVCDDDVTPFKGSFFRGILAKPAECKDEQYSDVHEIQFFELMTSMGSINLVCHNEHNGYYSGTGLKIHLSNFDNA